MDIYCIFCLSQMFEHPYYVWGHSGMERWASPQQNSKNSNVQAPPSRRLY